MGHPIDGEDMARRDLLFALDSVDEFSRIVREIVADPDDRVKMHARALAESAIRVASAAAVLDELYRIRRGKHKAPEVKP